MSTNVRLKCLICTLSLGLLAGQAVTKVSADLSLTAAGQTDYVIAIPASPAEAVRTAASELREHLLQVTGVAFDVVSEQDIADEAPQILLGPCNRLKSLLPDLDLNELPHDGIVLKTVGNKLVLAGRPPRGTLYATYTFLEDVIGCRWWTSTESYTPKHPNLKIPSLDVRHAPDLRYREAYYQDTFGGQFAARMKLNGHHHGVPVEFGDHYRFVGFVHTFYPFLPPSKYFAEHPDWYSEIDGKRTTERAQLCLTNEEMRREMVRVVLERIRKDPDAGFISISQNDWHGNCQCEKCREVDEAEGSPSGSLIRFVNAIAAEVEKEFPHVLVETLAYQYTRQPPKHVRPRDNVVVRLCSIECSFVQTLGDGPQNKAFRDDIKGWANIAPQLFVWDYVTNFSEYIVPHPNLRILAPNVRFFVDHQVIGLFEQGDAQSTIGDFIRLRAWLLAHLMWNPTVDEQTLIEQFLNGYYGAAGPHLKNYLDVVNDAGETSGTYVRCFMNDTSTYLSLDDLNRATKAFRKAEAAVASDPILARRVRRERMPLDHVWLKRYYALQRLAQAENKDFLGPEDPVAACDEFIQLAKEFQVGNYRERHSFGEYEPVLRSLFRPPGPPPKACESLPPTDWIDFQDNQFSLAKPGNWSEAVNDAAASDGHATRMPGDHDNWTIKCPLSNDFTPRDSWQCIVVARVEASATTGPAMTMGIYDSTLRKTVVHRTINVDEVSDQQYHLFDLGAHDLTNSMYIWVAPPKRPGEIEAIYVDRIYLVRAASSEHAPK